MTKRLNAKMIGERLRECRKQKKMTLADVGDVLGVTGAAVSLWERGTRNIDPDSFVELLALYEIEDVGVFYDFPVSLMKNHDLTANEKELLTFYRSLSQEKQEALNLFASFMCK